MVQTEDQYIFIHEALLEAATCGNTEVPARNLFAHIQKLTQPPSGETVTAMELEFKVTAQHRTGFAYLQRHIKGAFNHTFVIKKETLKVIAHWVRNFRMLKNKYDLMLCQSRLHTACETFVRHEKIWIRFEFLRFRIR